MSNGTCIAITKSGSKCTRYSRNQGLCMMHFNKQKIDSDNKYSESECSESECSESEYSDSTNSDSEDDKNNKINELTNEVESLTNIKIYSENKINLANNKINALTNEVKSLTNIKIYSENKFSELNDKIKTLTDTKTELENKINEINNEIEKKINIRVNMLKEEYMNNIFDNDKYNKMNTVYTKIKSDLNLITHETIGNKIEVKDLIIKNNIKIIVKYFKGTENNINEFITKFKLDLENLVNGINDSQYQYNKEWVEKIITNNDNYTVNFNEYFTAGDNAKIKIQWVKATHVENKYIVHIYPNIDHTAMIIDFIKNYKKIIDESQLQINNLESQIKIKDLIIQDRYLCNLCITEKINVFFSPCNHAYCCTICASKLNECPICRQKIKNKMIIYLN
jgi:hypothetical protein